MDPFVCLNEAQPLSHFLRKRLALSARHIPSPPTKFETR